MYELLSVFLGGYAIQQHFLKKNTEIVHAEAMKLLGNNSYANLTRPDSTMTFCYKLLFLFQSKDA